MTVPNVPDDTTLASAKSDKNCSTASPTRTITVATALLAVPPFVLGNGDSPGSLAGTTSLVRLTINVMYSGVGGLRASRPNRRRTYGYEVDRRLRATGERNSATGYAPSMRPTSPSSRT